jgi:Spy/CpxP family protein refolding chaperone
MRKLSLLTGLLIVLLTGRLFAQASNNDEQKKMLAVICRDFGVNQKQGTVIVSALQYNRQKLLAVVNNKTLSPFIRSSQIQVLENERQAKIREMLTPQQQARLKVLEQQQRIKTGGPANTNPLIKH